MDLNHKTVVTTNLQTAIQLSKKAEYQPDLAWGERGI
jgi:hypothetical protein